MATLAEAIGRKGDGVRADVFAAERYQRELERVFGRCWLFVGHDSLIPDKGDYFASFMGEDPVIVQRDQAGKVRVYLNRCRHRGNVLAVHDRGNAASFSCSYHGWTYADGKLKGVPLVREAYHGELDREKLGLIEPKVRVYGGLVFACWDDGAVRLEDYLGDARWWIDHFLIREELGGLEVVPGPQRYINPVNWKLPAENFAGDYYHFAATHGSVARALSQSEDRRIAATGATQARNEESYIYTVAANHKRGVAHGFYEVSVGPAAFEQDLRIAQPLGKEATEWVHERKRLLDEKLKQFEVRPYSFHVANLFPNFALIGVGSALYAKGLILHHPRGASRTEVWVWCAVEKNAPDVVKRHARFVLAQRQSAAGLVAPDDHENFERINETLSAGLAPKVPLHYAMAMSRDADDARPAAWQGKAGWPGKINPQMTEVIQRDFYRCWEDLMARDPQ